MCIFLGMIATEMEKLMDMVTKATHIVDTLATTTMVLDTHMVTEPSIKTQHTES